MQLNDAALAALIIIYLDSTKLVPGDVDVDALPRDTGRLRRHDAPTYRAVGCFELQRACP